MYDGRRVHSREVLGANWIVCIRADLDSPDLLSGTEYRHRGRGSWSGRVDTQVLREWSLLLLLWGDETSEDRRGVRRRVEGGAGCVVRRLRTMCAARDVSVEEGRVPGFEPVSVLVLTARRLERLGHSVTGSPSFGGRLRF